MGEPVPIRVLAEQLIRLAGKQPYKDIPIIYTGLRPGEKLHETLFYSDEDYRPTSHPKVLEAGVRAFSRDVVLGNVPRLRDAIAEYDTDTIREVLFATMPEFSPLEQDAYISSAKVVPFPAREAVLARTLQLLLKLVGLVEVIGDGVLVAVGDEDQGVTTCLDSLINGILDKRTIDDRQHFLRNRLGCRQKACPEPCHWKNSLTSGASVIAVEDVPHENTASYGIVATEAFDGRKGRISQIVEKPKPEDAPSDLAVVGRYVLSPKIFELLEQTRTGAGGEIQLTDAMDRLMQSQI